MKLYLTPGSCALSCHIALEWTGSTYDVELMGQEDTHAPKFLEINPKGKVPALGFGDAGVLTEALAILVWIGDQEPDTGLVGTDTLSRARVLEALSELTGEMHPAFAPLFVPDRYTDDPDGHDAVQAAATKRVKAHYTRWNEALAERDYILGDGRGRRTVADAYLFALSRWTGTIGAKLSDWPELARFNALMREDEGVMSALKAEGLN